MQQRRRRQPRHQAGVLNRIPKPPATPAKDVIGPKASGRDPQCQEYPCPEHPCPHRPRKHRPHLTGDQRANRETKGNRQADIAQIECWRVEGEARVLQQRIQPLPFLGHRRKPRKRVGRQQQESIKTKANKGLPRQRRQHRRLGQAPFHHRDKAAGQPHHRHPQQHRAFMIAPGSGKFIQQRLGRMRVHRHQLDRQISLAKRGYQHGQRQ